MRNETALHFFRFPQLISILIVIMNICNLVTCSPNAINWCVSISKPVALYCVWHWVWSYGPRRAVGWCWERRTRYEALWSLSRFETRSFKQNGNIRANGSLLQINDEVDLNQTQTFKKYTCLLTTVEKNYQLWPTWRTSPWGDGDSESIHPWLAVLTELCMKWGSALMHPVTATYTLAVVTSSDMQD